MQQLFVIFITIIMCYAIATGNMKQDFYYQRILNLKVIHNFQPLCKCTKSMLEGEGIKLYVCLKNVDIEKLG